MVTSCSSSQARPKSQVLSVTISNCFIFLLLSCDALLVVQVALNL